MSAPTTTTLIGQGMLSWSRIERVSDRYGSVMLLAENGNDTLPLEESCAGRTGRLVAIVQQQRLSSHIGDLFRGLAPPRSLEDAPRVGSKWLLGEGEAFYIVREGAHCIGLKPAVDREADWLKPECLYHLHEQRVALLFEEQS